MITKSTWIREVLAGGRFQFGNNWKKFLSTLSEDRINSATKSIQDLLAEKDLKGKSFLDIGCGSGLMSLVARKLGAKVTSFDYDKNSVECAKYLKNKFFKDDPEWKILEGSILDEGFIKELGSFDVVYSWGVLHHTGSMWKALRNALIPLSSDYGILAIAIYNDNGFESTIWLKIKSFYNSGKIQSYLVRAFFIPIFTFRTLASGLIKHKNPLFVFKNYRNKRGMNVYYDWIDWLGGYPFEVASVEDIFKFYKNKGGKLLNLKSTSTNANNQFVFEFKN